MIGRLYLDILPKAIPIFVLLALGYLLKQREFLKVETINELKKLIINFSLPAVLFISFLNIDIQINFLWIVLIIILINLLMLYLGKVFAVVLGKNDPYFPLVFTGFEVGMLGIPLFAAIYGLDNVKFMGVIDIGQEFYVWFILLAILLKLKNSNQNNNFKYLFKTFISSPIIISIFSALLLNGFGIRDLLKKNLIYISVINSFELLASLTIPLILIVIGYEMRFKLNDIALSLKIILLRISLYLILGVLINKYIFVDLLSLSKMYSRALLSVLILPPPFILPFFITSIA